MAKVVVHGAEPASCIFWRLMLPGFPDFFGESRKRHEDPSGAGSKAPKRPFVRIGSVPPLSSSSLTRLRWEKRLRQHGETKVQEVAFWRN